jgi:hypothetical protein
MNAIRTFLALALLATVMAVSSGCWWDRWFGKPSCPGGRCGVAEAPAQPRCSGPACSLARR